MPHTCAEISTARSTRWICLSTGSFRACKRLSRSSKNLKTYTNYPTKNWLIIRRTKVTLIGHASSALLKSQMRRKEKIQSHILYENWSFWKINQPPRRSFVLSDEDSVTFEKSRQQVDHVESQPHLCALQVCWRPLFMVKPNQLAAHDENTASSCPVGLKHKCRSFATNITKSTRTFCQRALFNFQICETSSTTTRNCLTNKNQSYQTTSSRSHVNTYRQNSTSLPPLAKAIHYFETSSKASKGA